MVYFSDKSANILTAIGRKRAGIMINTLSEYKMASGKLDAWLEEGPVSYEPGVPKPDTPA